MELIISSIAGLGFASFPSKQRLIRAGIISLGLLLAAPRAIPGLSASETGRSDSSGLLLVVNKGDQNLGIIDLAANRQVATVPVEGETGHEVAASPDGKYAYVPIYGNSGVGGRGTDGRLLRIIDLEARQIVGTVDFGQGVRPHAAVYNPVDGLLYVTTEITDSVTAVDPVARRVAGIIPTGQPESHMLAIAGDGRRAYTSNVGPGTVSVLDLKLKKVLGIIPVSPKAQRLALSVDDRRLFTSDQTRPRVAVIDTSAQAVEGWVELPSIGYGLATTPDGRWLLVALIRANQVGVVDLKTLKIVRTLDVPRAPQEILIRPDGKVAYVSCDVSRQVAVIDLVNWKVERLIEAGRGADGLAWAPLKPAATAALR